MVKNVTFAPRTHKDIAGRRMREEKWTGNILRLYAEEYFLYPTEDKEILETDMTIKFFKELEREIKNHEIIKLQINAKPRLGKSTIGIALGMWILKLIQKYFDDRTSNVPFSMRNMCRDDQEKTKAMRNPDLMYNVLVTDEQNVLEGTGENSTTETAQREVFSDVQAGRYVHNIDICPEGEIDKNTDIKLEVRNREGGMSHCYLYYKIRGSWIPLGFVDIDVSKLIANWKRVESRFFRYLKSKEEADRKYIEYWSKKDFYVEYMVKKYEKMELMNREGVLRPRELDYSGVVLEVVKKTQGLVKIMPLNKIRLPIQSYVEMEFKKQKIPASMVGVEQASRRVLSVLTLMTGLRDMEREKVGLVKRFKDGKINESVYNSLIKEVIEHKEELNSLIKIQVEELERYRDINDKYNKHLV